MIVTAIVPFEPTEEMLEAAAHELLPSYAGQVNNQMGYDIVSPEDLRVIWRAMIRAAPGIRKQDE